jgi:hypothetical protein
MYTLPEDEAQIVETYLSVSVLIVKKLLFQYSSFIGVHSF